MKLLPTIFRYKLALVVFATGVVAPALHAQTTQPPAQDTLVIAAQEAFGNRGGKNLPVLQDLALQTKGHTLEAWTAYWAHTARIKTLSPKDLKEVEQATFGEFRAFKRIYGEQYVTDRLRNDWLLELGKQGQWADFASEIDNFVMRDDPQVDCYDSLRRHLTGVTLNEEQINKAFNTWMKQRDGGEGCNTMGEALISAGVFNTDKAWQRMTRFIEADRGRAALRIAALLPEPVGMAMSQITDSASKWLTKTTLKTAQHKQLATLALARLAKSAPESAAQWLDSNGNALPAEMRTYAWGQVGKNAATSLDERAPRWYANTGNGVLDDEALAWKVRAALRAKDWKQVIAAVPQMTEAQLKDNAWTYWHARAQAASGNKEGAEQLYRAVASPLNFYGQLAMEELGEPVMAPPAQESPDTVALDERRNADGVKRALKLFALGLRNEAVREWNFSLRGLSDTQLHAAAELACQAQIWDRCINTSERIKGFSDIRQGFVMPFADTIKNASRNQGLDIAYVYGLIRQESRFVADAKSAVGAGGLMQVMPATATWTAKKLGVSLDAGANEVSTNVNIGTGYLRLLRDEFEGNEALAAAAYNAGPNRPRKWRYMAVGGGKMDTAAFAENVPFSETRDYIKKVLANATLYASLITGKPQSLKARLKTVGPASQDKVDDKELP
jgi:soluble lytic murein transglycosylase